MPSERVKLLGKTCQRDRVLASDSHGCWWRTDALKGHPAMPVGDKSSYTGKQRRQADHIADGYEKRGTGRREAERRAWATVNKETGGGKQSGSGRGKAVDRSSSQKGGRKGAASQSHAKRVSAGKKAARTRARRAK
jgi:plasmid stabilization system protein ParE